MWLVDFLQIKKGKRKKEKKKKAEQLIVNQSQQADLDSWIMLLRVTCHANLLISIQAWLLFQNLLVLTYWT